MWGEEDVGLVVGGGEGQDVEDVWGDYVGGEEVDLGGGVGGAVVVEVTFVGLAAMEDGAFYLDAEEVAPSVAVRSLRAGSLVGDSSLRAGYQEVVGGAVSARLGQDQAVLGGAELETEFGPFSAEFGVLDVLAAGAIGHGGPWGETVRFAILGMRLVVSAQVRPPGLKPGLNLETLRGAEAPLFHVTACVTLPHHCMRHSSTSLHASLFHVTVWVALPRRRCVGW